MSGACGRSRQIQFPWWLFLARPHSGLCSVLWRFITCGEMIICANNQREVDIVLHSGDVPSRDTVTAVLIQLKNDQVVDDEVSEWTYSWSGCPMTDIYMYPAVIRMVFALASRTTFGALGCPRRHSLLSVVTSSLIDVCWTTPITALHNTVYRVSKRY